MKEDKMKWSFKDYRRFAKDNSKFMNKRYDIDSIAKMLLDRFKGADPGLISYRELESIFDKCVVA